MRLRANRTRQCRNTIMPEGLTETFVERIKALPVCRKTAYLQEEFLSKYVSPDTAPANVRRNAAIRKWLAAERDNEATNERLLNTDPTFQILRGVSFSDFVETCQAMIVEIIGDTPPLEALIGSFSGGATTSRPRTKSHPALKYLGRAHVTERCLDLFMDLIHEEVPGWLQHADLDWTVVPGNVMFTVPKKTDIDRCACKEPDVNMFVQKGIGSYIRASLLKRGINLNDQSINRRLAREGSVTGKLATLDLSSASDSVTRELVMLMLPVTWFTLLDSVRSEFTVIHGELHRNEMFSSMGNGFTFELESLLFYVLTRATAYYTGTSGRVSVYGDDIICGVAMVPDLIWVLQWFGFTVNTEKSHYSGEFRESCGGHYMNGYDVTPFYLKGPLHKLTDVIHMANSLRKWSESEVSINDPAAEEIWLWLASYVPKELWGGEDTSFKFQLASNGLSEARLVEETKQRNTGLGGYLHWLNATWRRDRETDGIQTSRLTSNRNVFRVRRYHVSTVTRMKRIFLHEVRGFDTPLP